MTFKMGWACYEAAQDIARQMVDRAARIWEVDSKDVEYSGGALRHKQDTELHMTFKELASQLNATGGPIVGRATVNPSGVGSAFALHIVDVEVDPETGKVTIPALYRPPGCGQGHPPQLRGRPDPGRGRAGHRLGAE